MSDIQGLRIVVSADVQAALRGLTQMTDATAELATEGVGNIQAVNLALADLREAQKGVGNTAELKVVNRAIKDLSNEARDLKRAGTEGFDEFGKKAETAGKGVVGAAGNAYSAIRKLAFILPGIGIAGIFGAIGSGLVIALQSLNLFGDELITTADKTKRAEAEAKKLHDTLVNLKSATEITETSTGSESGNIIRVRLLAAAIQDTNKTYKERQNALTELRETNKAYFGDLTLEAESLKTLAGRVSEYSQALITEAVVKGQVTEIAKLSSELQIQARALDKMKDARDRLQGSLNKAIVTNKDDFGGGGAGSSKVLDLQNALLKTNTDLDKQRQAVLLLRTSIATYTGELEKNIDAQLKQKPLKDITTKQKDELKSAIPILQEIKRIYDELAKPSKEPLFRQLLDSKNVHDIELLNTQIAEAIQGGIKDPKNKAVFDELVIALNAKLTHLKNPDLHSRINFDLAEIKPSDIDKLESKIEKAFGAKEIHLKVSADLKESIKESNFGKEGQAILLQKAQEDAFNNLPAIKWTPEIQVVVDKATVEKGLQKQLGDTLNKALDNVAKSGFANLGESIGTAIASGQSFITAAGHSILSSIGDLIQQIGKALIEYGAVKEGLDHVLAGGIAIPGIAAIAIGVAAVAIGALVKQSFKPKAFATGGIITGPTLGLVGEAGPEVVFPLNQLGRFINQSSQGNQEQQIRIVGKISGRDLALVRARDTKNQAFV